MSITEVMDGLRLWMVFIGSAIIVLASTEIGFQLGLRQQ